MHPPQPRFYHLFRLTSSAPRSRRTIAIMTLVAALGTGLAVERVRSRHEVVRLGYQLSRANAEVRGLREGGRRLELERATLTNPERINTLAAAMGMQPASADVIRVVAPEPPTAVSEVSRD
jgi:cell division protein FtsL